MQLKRKAVPAGPALRRMLAAATTGLLAGAHANAQGPPADQPSTSVDSGLLYYQEDGRVRAFEPNLNVSQQIGENSLLTFGLTADSVTGATPLGAVPSTLPQSYIHPYKTVPLGTLVTTTSASGGSVVKLVPPATGATSQTLSSTLTVPPNTYPLDQGFKDLRYAANVGWQQTLLSEMTINGGLAYSNEHDYRSMSANMGVTKDFKQHNTTLSAAVNYESDLSFPVGGTPTPLSVMSGDWKGPDATRAEVDAVLGLTQIMTRRWLSSISYSYAQANGYQNDPYKIISLVDPVSGQPLSQLYESRPDSRRKQSIYFDNKVHLNQDVVDLGLRAYRDDWGVKSVTADLRYRYQIGNSYYLEPHARFYKQESADFFHYYLVSGETLPEFASADTRLAQSHALTYGLKFGMSMENRSEFNIRIEYYNQQGDGSPANAIGQLQQQNLFPALSALTVLFGYKLAF